MPEINRIRDEEEYAGNDISQDKTKNSDAEQRNRPKEEAENINPDDARNDSGQENPSQEDESGSQDNDKGGSETQDWEDFLEDKVGQGQEKAKDPGDMPKPDPYTYKSLWQRFKELVNKIVNKVVDVVGGLAHTFVFGRTEPNSNFTRDLEKWMQAKELYDKETKDEKKEEPDKQAERKNPEKEKQKEKTADNRDKQAFDVKKYMKENGYKLEKVRDGSTEPGKQAPDLYSVTVKNENGKWTAKVMDAGTLKSIASGEELKEKFDKSDYRINAAKQLERKYNFNVKESGDLVELTPKDADPDAPWWQNTPIYASKDILDCMTRDELRDAVQKAKDWSHEHIDPVKELEKDYEVQVSADKVELTKKGAVLTGPDGKVQGYLTAGKTVDVNKSVLKCHTRARLQKFLDVAEVQEKLEVDKQTEKNGDQNRRKAEHSDDIKDAPGKTDLKVIREMLISGKSPDGTLLQNSLTVIDKEGRSIIAGDRRVDITDEKRGRYTGDLSPRFREEKITQVFDEMDQPIVLSKDEANKFARLSAEKRLEFIDQKFNQEHKQQHKEKMSEGKGGHPANEKTQDIIPDTGAVIGEFEIVHEGDSGMEELKNACEEESAREEIPWEEYIKKDELWEEYTNSEGGNLSTPIADLAPELVESFLAESEARENEDHNEVPLETYIDEPSL